MSSVMRALNAVQNLREDLLMRGATDQNGTVTVDVSAGIWDEFKRSIEELEASQPPEDLIRFDFNSDGRVDSKMITHDEMRQRYADLLASNALSYHTSGAVPDDDELIQIARKFPGITGVVYEQWKDGLSIDVPTADLRNFALALFDTQQPPAQSAPDGCYELMESLATALYAAVHAGKLSEADRIKSDDGTVEIAELLDLANAMLATQQPPDQKEESSPEIPVNEESLIRDAKPRCHGGRDGECIWEGCPQIRDNEPEATGRHCPLDDGEDPYQ